MDSFYEQDVGKSKQFVIRLTPLQVHKLRTIRGLFRVSGQRIFTDLLDEFYCDYLKVQSGVISPNGAVKDSAQKTFDNYIGLRGIRREVNPPYHRQQATT